MLTYGLIKIPGEYCCPADTPIHDCTWRGSKFDCADAKCTPDEIAIRVDQQGNSIWTCSCLYPPSALFSSSSLTYWIGGRKKINCCKITKVSLKCKKTTCDIEPDFCEIAADSYSKRYLLEYSPDKRGLKRPFDWPLWGLSYQQSIATVDRIKGLSRRPYVHAITPGWNARARVQMVPHKLGGMWTSTSHGIRAFKERCQDSKHGSSRAYHTGKGSLPYKICTDWPMPLPW